MPADESSALLVARFLKANSYLNSYQAFIDEANLSEDAGDVSTTSLTLEKLLEEKRLFDQSNDFEKLALTSDAQEGWTSNAPAKAVLVSSLPTRANLLSTMVTRVSNETEILLASTSDHRVSTIELPSLDLKASWTTVQNSPTLCQVVLQSEYHVSASMSGAVVLARLATGEVLEQRKDHSKYVVGLTSLQDGNSLLLASAGWDNIINVYAMDMANADVKLGEPRSRLSLPTKPEALVFTRHPDTTEPVLVVSRADSSYLYFYSTLDATLLGRQNLAPYSNAWVAFTPTSIALCPIDDTLVAVATNSVPHMKLIVVKLLISSTAGTTIAPQTSREQSVAEQRVADREHNAIKLHCNTMSSQTLYSSPLVVWRPSGKGVWVNSDDGIIRGLDTLTGKVVSELKYHEPGSKVRTLWAGHSGEGSTQEEVLVSGGFDHKLIIWRP